MANVNASEDDWYEDAPDHSTGEISYGDDEIRYLRMAVRSRLEKEHLTPAGSGAGGEHREGSAKIWTATSAPTTLPDGSTSITGNEGIAEGMVWTDTGNDYVCQVYAGGAWHDLGYVKSSLTLSSGNGWTVTNNGTGDIANLTNASTGDGIGLTNSSTGKGINLTNSSTGNGIVIANSGGGDGININNTNADSQGIVITSGGASNNKGICIAHTGATGNPAGLVISVSDSGAAGTGISISASDASRGVLISSTSTTEAVHIDHSGSDNAVGIKHSGIGTCVLAHATGGSHPVISVTSDGSASGPSLKLDNQVNAAHIRFTGDPSPASPQDGDFWFDGTDLKLRVGTTTYTISKT